MDQIGLSHRPRRKPNGLTKADRETMKSDDLLKRDFHSDVPLEKSLLLFPPVPYGPIPLHCRPTYHLPDSGSQMRWRPHHLQNRYFPHRKSRRSKYCWYFLLSSGSPYFPRWKHWLMRKALLGVLICVDSSESALLGDSAFSFLFPQAEREKVSSSVKNKKQSISFSVVHLFRIPTPSAMSAHLLR